MKVSVLVCSLLLFVGLSAAQNTSLRWSSFSAGFALTQAPLSKTTSIVGQPFVGRVTGPASNVISGFLADTLFRRILVAVREESGMPLTFALHQNYPNPFNPTTTIRYQLAGPGAVRLTIFDVLGREVAVLVNEIQQAGYYKVNWNASDVASGVYFSRLIVVGDPRTGRFVATSKMILVR